jgi:mono/diheme cytochrome c family protein
MKTSSEMLRLAVLATLAAGAAALAHGPKDWPVPAAARAMKNPVAVTPEALKAAKAIYDDKCSQCHGDTGKGDGPESLMYSVKPANFADAHMMGEMTDGEIFYKMTEGREPMPGFKRQLTEEQRWQLVHYIRTFAPKPKNEPAKAAKKPSKK